MADTSAEHDEIGIEDRGHRGDGVGEPFALLTDHLDHRGVVAACRLEDVLRGQRSRHAERAGGLDDGLARDGVPDYRARQDSGTGPRDSGTEPVTA
ncbi:hypothetical protein FBY35_1735 [Streptomyces sp. SLBN-118]|nr:hypothetical protein FBY35_1735 [Streptomyces sp. SLBN-118]